MRYLLTGGSGLLGKELQKFAKFIAPPREEMDITNKQSIIDCLCKYEPNVIVHAAAYTDTARADSISSEAKLCFDTNVIGTRNIATVAKCPIIFISTETCINPYNFYSITKMQAENEIKKHKEYQIFRIGMRKNPFPYESAPCDMYTIGDYPEKIAQLVCNNLLELKNQTKYVGTGIKTMYELALRTKKVKKISIKDMSSPIPDQKELLHLEDDLFL